MIKFLVVRMQGDVPDTVAQAVMEATTGVLRAWGALNPDPELRADVDLLDGSVEGPSRRRKSVLDRLYKAGWDGDPGA